MKNSDIYRLTRKLNKLSNIIDTYSRDTKPFIQAEEKYESIINSVMSPQDYGAIVNRIGRKLTNFDFAKTIVARQNGESIQSVIHNYKS